MTQPYVAPTIQAVVLRLVVAMLLIGGLIAGTIWYSTYVPPAKTPRPAASKAQPAAPRAKARPKTASTPPQPATTPPVPAGVIAPQPTTPVLTGLSQLTGSRYSGNPTNPLAVPAVSFITLPRSKDSYAIWGSLGTDDAGQIWTGISTQGGHGSSAQLLSYNPQNNQVSDQGFVLDQLKKLGLFKEDMGQSKIHSRIIQASDGYLYFSSQDEQGEAEDGSKDPLWGSYLWRTHAPAYEWEPLLHVPQGLIAVAGFGTDIYALGYHNHVLYRFDTLTGQSSSVVVGSQGGHISRNILVDHNANVFVPRLTPGLQPGDGPVASLVQYDRQLREIASTPLEHYLGKTPSESHGIISFVAMKDGSIIFATHQGFLYRIAAPSRFDSPSSGRLPTASKVSPIGYFHPAGSRYTPTMHTYDGSRYLVGVTKLSRPAKGQPAFEWMVYDLWTNESKAMPLDIPPPKGQSTMNLLLYGSMARDKQGSFYIAGSHLNAHLPLLIKLTPVMK